MKTGFFERSLRLLGSVIAVLLAFSIIYLVVQNDNRTIESPVLLTILNGIFITSVSLFTAVISTIGYIRSGLWRFLSLSAGSVVFGSTALLAGTLMRTYGANTSITIYNIGALLAAICFSITVFHFGTISITEKYPVKRILISFITMILALSIIGMIIVFSIRQIFPPFFIQGIGSTPIRQVVLGLVIALMLSTAINVFRDYSETKTNFNFWYSLGLFCMALGFGGVYIMNTSGNLLNWVARLAQYIGNVYVLFAVVTSIYKANSRSSSFDEILATLFQDPELNYRLIMDIDPNGVVVLNHQGRVLGWNRKAEYLFGYTNNEMIGSSLSDIVFPDNNDSVDQLIKSLQEQPADQKTSVTTELLARCKDNSLLPVSFSISGTKTGFGWMGVATLNDISLRNKAEEQLLYQANLLSNVHDALIATDQNDEISYWNPAAEKMFGWTTREAIGMHIKDILSSTGGFGQDKDTVLKISHEESNYEGEAIYSRKDGIPIVVEARTTTFKEPDGKFKGSMTAYRDITTRMQALEALAESEEKYRNIVETANEGIMIADLSGVITYANPRIAEILGYAIDELVGMSGVDLIDPADESSVYDRMKKRIEGIKEEYDIKFYHKNGGELWLHASGTPIYDVKGSHVGNLAMYTDITKRMRMEVELKQYAAWLKSA
ncbi:MAG: PAS domain S-box protein, partial [Saccharofermentanales bacterium]